MPTSASLSTITIARIRSRSCPTVLASGTERGPVTAPHSLTVMISPRSAITKLLHITKSPAEPHQPRGTVTSVLEAPAKNTGPPRLPSGRHCLRTLASQVALGDLARPGHVASEGCQHVAPPQARELAGVRQHQVSDKMIGALGSNGSPASRTGRGDTSLAVTLRIGRRCSRVVSLLCRTLFTPAAGRLARGNRALPSPVPSVPPALAVGGLARRADHLWRRITFLRLF